MSIPVSWWVIFNVTVLAMLALDLGVFHRKVHAVRLKEAVVWSIVWILVALAFNVGLWWVWPEGAGGYTPKQAGIAFFTGYLLERALSIDNIFVFVVLFRYFQVPAQFHHRVLFWGILGAMIMRAVFIAAGVTLINMFDWMIWVLGLFLIFTGVKLGLAKGVEVHPEHNPMLRLIRRFLPVTPHYAGSHFFARVDGRLLATPLFIVLLMVETTDVVFAIDSIPAILGVTQDGFIVYSSNVFAILGLRALYFVLAGMMDLFHYLNYGLSAVLVFIGAKMVAEGGWGYHVSLEWSLGLVVGLITLSVIASLLRPRSTATAPAE